jgi:hypothetical protein
MYYQYKFLKIFCIDKPNHHIDLNDSDTKVHVIFSVMILWPFYIDELNTPRSSALYFTSKISLRNLYLPHISKTNIRPHSKYKASSFRTDYPGKSLNQISSEVKVYEYNDPL